MSQFELNFLVRFQSCYLVVSFENKFQQKEWKKEAQHNVHCSAKPPASQGPHLGGHPGKADSKCQGTDGALAQCAACLFVSLHSFLMLKEV